MKVLWSHIERGYVIVGSPDEVVQQLTHLATDLNVGAASIYRG